MSEKQEKQEQEKEKKSIKSRIKNEKKFYLFTAIGCAVALIAIIVVAVVATNAGKVETPSVNTPPPASSTTRPSVDEDEKPNEDKPVVVVPEGMTLPIESTTVSNDYGFYHNQTLNTYYEHKGVDFTANAGSEVKAVQSGTIESIYKEDLLLGTEIVVNHGDGLKTVYRFVTEKEGLKVGDKVERGEVIATVAEPTGNEYKDGAHLHFEVLENGKQVDPTLHLTLEEK